MKYLKLFENFDKVFENFDKNGRWISPCPNIDDKFDFVTITREHTKPDYTHYLTSDVVKKLNDKNNNIEPSIIKDLFIDLFDDEIISNIEVKKFYYVRNYQNSEKKYAGYVLEVKIEFSDNIYNEDNIKDRNLYLEKRGEVLKDIEDHLNHKSLNQNLSKWNINDGDTDGMGWRRNEFFKNIYDEFDLWGLSLDLQTLK